MPDSLYERALSLTSEIEGELKRLSRWEPQPLPPERFENMGAFGENTMSFEQWLQFILIPRIQQIVKEKDRFPDGSMLAPYAIRVFDGDPEAHCLHEILYKIDALCNGTEVIEEKKIIPSPVESPTITLGSTEIPEVVYLLTNLLPQYPEEDLESQLQTFDSFLAVLSPAVRAPMGQLIRDAASKTTNPACREKLQKAAYSVENGGRAALPYNHDEAMKKYIEEHKKSFPS